MKRTSLLIALVLLVITLVACAAGPNELAGTRDEEGEVAGFWLGLWHGFITPFTFVISLFSHSVVQPGLSAGSRHHPGRRRRRSRQPLKALSSANSPAPNARLRAAAPCARIPS
jgi:hypothetical protein